MTGKRPRILFLCAVALFALGAAGGLFFLFKSRALPPPAPLSLMYTLAGEPQNRSAARFQDPFGIAIDVASAIYVADGETGNIRQIMPDGTARIIAGSLDTPSAIAIAPDGSLVVAETGAHVIRRIDTLSGQVNTLAGVAGKSGFADGDGASALFNAPVGVAVGRDGTIFVADTYNDRIRVIDRNGQVSTLSGGDKPGYVDAPAGLSARFDTPCGIALMTDGSLVVADTGNHRLRRVDPASGAASTFAGNGEKQILDGPMLAASFNEPTGVAVAADGGVYVADAGSAALRLCRTGASPEVSTLAGGKGAGFADGPLDVVRLNRPTGVAVAPDGTIALTDTGNRLVRLVVGRGRERGAPLAPEDARALVPTAAEFRASAPPRWPYAPPERTREIAATFGELRGDLTMENKEAWFHNGLDIPGGYGETVRAVRGEKILLPLAVAGVGTARERIRFPTLGYIHLRIGRDARDRPLDESRFVLRKDETGQVSGVRVRRGTRFLAGDAIGTLNNQNHVHLIAGPLGAELNALAALELPGIKDTVAPTIEANGVSLFDASWHELRAETRSSLQSSANKQEERVGRINLTGDVYIVVRAYDQMDGNAARRRLGLYRLGYQIFRDDGMPARGFDNPRMTISFETLPETENTAQLAYAEGSRAGATGQTIFAYIVTNTVRDRTAASGAWHTSELAPGDYVLRVMAEDFFGNRTTRDVPVRVNAPSN